MGAINLKTPIPGPKSTAFLERRKRSISAGVAIGMSQICASSAKGALITDLDGNTFIDLTGGIGCMNVGHSAPAVVEAVQAQAAELQHACFQVTMYEPYVALVEKLIAITPGSFPKKGCLFNSGAEAVENAVKIARRATGRQSIVCFEHGFHGRTLLTMSLTSKVKPYKDGFGPMAPEIYKAPLPYTFRRPSGQSEDACVEEQIEAWHDFLNSTVAPERVAAVILEPVLGEGGFIVPPMQFVKEVEKTCRDNGIVLIADEIQSGFARTGKMFACEHFDLQPDMLTLAKSLSNGYPLSAVIGRAELMDAVQAGGLGGTFAGNPVACTAALASIQTIEREGLCDRAEKLGAFLRESLINLSRRVSCVGEIRGLGAMLAFEVVKNGREPNKEKAEEIVVACARKGVLVLTAGLEGNVIRFLMPLNIKDEHIREAMDVLHEVIAGL
jgi:4-aminobutyrate aminotransferase / (S)-3-amino-2-methylpropionate transaminase / 5-aminovalerate transaminase